MKIRSTKLVPSETKLRPMVVPPTLAIPPYQVLELLLLLILKINFVDSLRRENSLVVLSQAICPYFTTTLLIHNFFLHCSPHSKLVFVFADSDIGREVKLFILSLNV